MGFCRECYELRETCDECWEIQWNHFLYEEWMREQPEPEYEMPEPEPCDL